MRRRLPKGSLLRSCVLVLLVAAGAACSESDPEARTPGLAARGTAMTTAKPARQDLDNRVSLAGKVTMNPVFGVVAPVAGQIRYRDVEPPESTPTKATRVASIWAKGRSHRIDVPAGAVFAGRLVDDRSNVAAGMPVVSAKRIGYGLVAEIDGAQAYQISDSLATVQAQIKNGPGPFACKVLGTIAALPAGTIPDPPAPEPSTGPSAGPGAPPVVPVGPPPDPRQPVQPSEPTGMRVVCTAPSNVKLINGATATLEVVTARARNALVLPVEAVAGGQGRGKVDVVGPDGNRETRDVVLGLSDGKVVQITSGLTGDETVAVPGPDLPPAKPAQPGGPADPMGGK
ncbi:efflux RND transporter periplasmic adaptor subunit [Plantactinospora sp. KLBMP9567]|uniref:efflux RND transporter periplasmic adaptor subunit n=1 Tax=Plantactinospora sp. KLBMP9567 TaxID=3085900 RepID=UPI0029811266|nr:efflux RND transporter periplasmic adaptor subunit [Plantactinospora sp. KLBMP9567]MDW5324923.1 efflux RND transporter periplasmic adaptor subunit [Plantactinospora sp. KLBMP9567]